MELRLFVFFQFTRNNYGHFNKLINKINSGKISKKYDCLNLIGHIDCFFLYNFKQVFLTLPPKFSIQNLIDPKNVLGTPNINMIFWIKIQLCLVVATEFYDWLEYSFKLSEYSGHCYGTYLRVDRFDLLKITPI